MDRTLAHLRRIVLPDETASISSTHSFNLPLIDVLLGIQQPSWRPQVPPVIPTGTGRKSETRQSGNEVEWLGENLNDSQKEAILFCLKAEHVACIHGPPGVCTKSNPWNPTHD
jgi:DNA polymerase alpha-associated DNA helicase A